MITRKLGFDFEAICFLSILFLWREVMFGGG